MGWGGGWRGGRVQQTRTLFGRAVTNIHDYTYTLPEFMRPQFIDIHIDSPYSCTARENCCLSTHTHTHTHTHTLGMIHRWRLCLSLSLSHNWCLPPPRVRWQEAYQTAFSLKFSLSICRASLLIWLLVGMKCSALGLQTFLPSFFVLNSNLHRCTGIGCFADWLVNNPVFERLRFCFIYRR